MRTSNPKNEDVIKATADSVPGGGGGMTKSESGFVATVSAIGNDIADTSARAQKDTPIKDVVGAAKQALGGNIVGAVKSFGAIQVQAYTKSEAQAFPPAPMGSTIMAGTGGDNSPDDPKAAMNSHLNLKDDKLERNPNVVGSDSTAHDRPIHFGLFARIWAFISHSHKHGEQSYTSHPSQAINVGKAKTPDMAGTVKAIDISTAVFPRSSRAD